MGRTRNEIFDCGLIAMLDTPVGPRLYDWAIAVSQGDIKLLGIPATQENVAEVTSELADEVDLRVGVCGVLNTEQVSMAFAAAAHFVYSPICDETIIAACKAREITVICGAATPTEVARAVAARADMVAINPVGAMGGPNYFQALCRQFRDVPLLAAGCVDIESAPVYLETGATAAIVDRGVFPDPSDPSALQIIRARASALSEVCAEAMGMPKRSSLTDILIDARSLAD